MALQGQFEFLCGVRDLDDPAMAVLGMFPKVRVIECHTTMPNGKAGVLMDLVEAARFPILVVNDADIRVEPDYLARVTAPLCDPAVGLVTCLYRAAWATRSRRDLKRWASRPILRLPLWSHDWWGRRVRARIDARFPACGSRSHRGIRSRCRLSGR